MKDVLSIVLVSLRDQAPKGGLRCLCALALILVAWGCGGQRMGAQTLPLLPLGATVQVSELPYIVTGTTVPEIRMSLQKAATEAMESSHVDPQVDAQFELPVWSAGGLLRDDLDRLRSRSVDPGAAVDRS